jgi:hypothetical protein
MINGKHRCENHGQLLSPDEIMSSLAEITSSFHELALPTEVTKIMRWLASLAETSKVATARFAR